MLGEPTMQLKKIKLAGFKSFVDPTVVHLPSHLVAIVGPNGCGKSNIIDAVCWVMGESSAKYLRGESLTDVIFNGSSTRKPVGLATVELIFDNQDGSLGGEYASYAEISIRRQITRDSESSYFLNGTRCRRRDIIDIFLGTGLGPRSYAIIGQNMISRVIEAKPDDMRVYLEEAAGVSKYKERRRETENRIQHAKDNVARLNDVRAELEKQLTTLKRQAGAAEKFKILKQEERTLRSQWLTIQWRELDIRLVNDSLQIQQQSTGLEARQTALGEIKLQLDYKRDAQHLTTETFQEVQRRYYAIGNDISRLEQEIQHHQERRQQMHADIQQAENDWLDIKNNSEESQEQLQELMQDILQLEPESESAFAAAKEANDVLQTAEKAMHQWQNQWDEFNTKNSKTTQTAQVEQTHIQHLEQQLLALKQRQIKLDQDSVQFDFVKVESDLEVLLQQISAATEETEHFIENLSDIKDNIYEKQIKRDQLTTQLDQLRHELQQLRGQQASLEALQQTALGQRNNPVITWLEANNLDKQPRLAQSIEVESGWEQAVEKVLGPHLQAVCVDELTSVARLVEKLKEGTLSAFSKPTTTHIEKYQANTLLSKVTSPWPLQSLLKNIYIAESLDEALTLCHSLSPEESVITRDGIWLSGSWLRVSRDNNPAAGVFQREQELKQLTHTINEKTLIQDELENELHDSREQLKDYENQRDELQKMLNQAHAQAATIQAQHKVQAERFDEYKARAVRTRKELDETLLQIEKAETELTTARHEWQEAMSELEHMAGQRDTLMAQRDTLREQLQTAKTTLNDVKENVHQLEIRLQTTKSQQGSLQQTLVRMQSRMSMLAERKSSLQTELNNFSSNDVHEKELSIALSQRLHLEDELNKARSKVDAVNHELHSLEDKRQEIEREIVQCRDMLETLRVESQGSKVKAETLKEQIQESGFQLETILSELPSDIVAEDWQMQLEQVTQRITRLGAINLVAIEEFASCSERKDYLDKQNADLLEGLATLENAIAKIDKETRARFKETFDKVNERFQELFPVVFGGGRAYLELIGDNLLDAGITLMACPPGKRNSSIHLLSGGEKALTAIALVFSIFHLNPAPFCMLDEVDAPLDDANVGRYCHLVKKMSEKTQFIFISHNKLAIEMGEHLMGVTMHEPGVSRLVSVDVHEAVTLAGA
jgi:chromosome segregation protein